MMSLRQATQASSCSTPDLPYSNPKQKFQHQYSKTKKESFFRVRRQSETSTTRPLDRRWRCVRAQCRPALVASTLDRSTDVWFCAGERARVENVVVGRATQLSHLDNKVTSLPARRKETAGSFVPKVQVALELWQTDADLGRRARCCVEKHHGFRCDFVFFVIIPESVDPATSFAAGEPGADACAALATALLTVTTTMSSSSTD